jgi:hypothetical protein
MEEKAVFDSQNNLHCLYCRQYGGNTPRFGLKYTFKNGHSWNHTFPCVDSRDDFLTALRPFISFYNLYEVEHSF